MPDRLITIEAPGFDSSQDELIVTTLTGFEGISRLFNFQLDLQSKKLDIQPDQFIGKHVDIAILRNSGGTRHINGFISRFTASHPEQAEGPGQVYRQYHAEVVPWLWFLTQTTDCRVFNKPPETKLKALAIIEEVLKECQHNDYSIKSMGQGKEFETEYCVQYRESDFNFISRLMEQFGIYYYFKHTQGSHQMVLSDSIGGYSDCVENNVSFTGRGGIRATDGVTFWEHDYEFVPGKFAHTDYDFKKPSTFLGRNSGQSSANLAGHEDYELFDYPGEYLTTADGKSLADVYMEVEEVAHDGARGGSTCRTFMAGHTTKLNDHPAGGENGEYVFASVQHVARQPGLRAGTGAVAQYINSFTCIPASVIFRAPRTTPKPMIAGAQTALVVGPQGDEIHCDKYGRVRVRFHWEREGVGKQRHEQNKPKTPDEKCTCWIRVANQMAGNKWGFMGLPRIGQEVVVNFLEADPDRPLIVGSVYNAEQMPHYPLPENNAKTYIKTNSTKGGDGFNELMFDDAKGAERLYMHAERDMDVVVKNDSREFIYNERHGTIGTDDHDGLHRELVFGNKETGVTKDKTEHIEGQYKLTVGAGKDGGDNPGLMECFIERKELKLVGDEGRHLTVEGDCNHQIGGKLSVKVKGDHHETAGSYALGAGSVAVNGTDIVIEGKSKITLKVGGSFVAIHGGGVDIMGPIVNINSGGSPGSGASASPQAPEPAQKIDIKEPDMPWDSKTGHKSAKD